MLIIDDEPGIRKALSQILEDEDYRVSTAEDAASGLELLREQGDISLIFLDVLLPNMGGLEALEILRRDWSDAEVIMISGHANVDMAVRAVKLGAFDFLEKPLSLDKVLLTARNALTIQKLKRENSGLKKRISREKDEILGTSASIEEVRSLMRQAAGSDARILIMGENGTGKELVARGIHRLSARSEGPFVEVNCAAIPDTLIESELFGHEKGAFTDAVSSRKGRFEMAHRGTLFMDEIGDMSLQAQAKVLRAIQEGTIERVGGEKTIETDVRIIAATNKDLELEVREGRFRQDLFFRLNVIPIRIPTLHDRAEDIPLLLLRFLQDLGAPPMEISPEAARLLQEYPWPGNVRELKNLAERVVVLHSFSADDQGRQVLGGSDLEELLPQAEGSNLMKNGGNLKTGDGQNICLHDILDLSYNEAKVLFEKRYLEYQLEKNGGVIARTEEALGIYPSNLHAKLRKFHIMGESKTP